MQIQAHACFHNSRSSPLSFRDVVYQAGEGPGKLNQPRKKRQFARSEPLFSRSGGLASPFAQRHPFLPSPPPALPPPPVVRANGGACACRQLRQSQGSSTAPGLARHQQHLGKIRPATPYAIGTRAQGIKPGRSCPHAPPKGNGSREKATRGEGLKQKTYNF